MATTTTDPFDKMMDRMEEAPATGPRFPLGLCVLGVVASSLGLVGAVLNLRWGAVVPADRTDALEAAWMYVNVMLVMVWLVAWPAVVLRRVGTGEARRGRLGWDAGALSVGAVPALGVAAFLSGVPWTGAAVMAALQGSLALLAWGALRAAIGRRRAEAVASGLLAAAAVGGPLAVYFWAEFYGWAGDGWYLVVPVMAVAHAARGMVDAGFWWVLGGWAALGAGMGTAPQWLERGRSSD